MIITMSCANDDVERKRVFGLVFLTDDYVTDNFVESASLVTLDKTDGGKSILFNLFDH